MPGSFKAKLTDCALDMKTIKGDKGTYLFLKAGKSYHVFVEIDAKEAAIDCGAAEGKNTQISCKEVWKRLTSNP